MRLQKFLAACGVGSRRACETLIAEGRVSVDGQTVTVRGTVVDPARQRVVVDGRPVTPDAPRYLLLNKPAGVLCTSHDPGGRPTFLDLLPPDTPRLFSVGRLDRDSEGLLLLTNDGALSNRLIHPRYHVEKTYRVWLARAPGAAEIERMRKGVMNRGEWLRVLDVRVVRAEQGRSCCDVVLGEGRNRHIRRIFETLDIPVTRLRRVRLGPLTLGKLPPGAFRTLTPREVRALYDAASGPGAEKPSPSDQT